MTAEETSKKENETKSEGSGPMGSGMFEMMSNCCTGEGLSSGCSTMMKGMMEGMRSKPCCAEKKENESEGGKK